MEEKWLKVDYCSPEYYHIIKKEEEEKWRSKGYSDAKCRLLKSDTKGLRMYVVFSFM